MKKYVILIKSDTEERQVSVRVADTREQALDLFFEENPAFKYNKHGYVTAIEEKKYLKGRVEV